MDDWEDLTASEWEDLTPIFWSLLKSKLGTTPPPQPPPPVPIPRRTIA